MNPLTYLAMKRCWRVVLCFFAGFLSLPLSGAAPPSPPNIVLILADDLGWTDLSCYGSKLYETPHIDRLARDGMKFTQAYAACCVFSPTRAAILTGKYPARLHVTDWIPGLPPENPKLLAPDWTKYLPLEEKTIQAIAQADPRGRGTYPTAGASYFLT